MNHDAQVLVVGAGPAGSSAAFVLARAGVDALLLEKRRFPRDKLCGGFLAGRTLGLLRDLHGDALPESLFHHREDRFAIYHDGALVVERDLGGEMAFVQRSEFDEALARRAVGAGARLEEGCEAVGFSSDADGVTVELKDGSRRRAAWVVAADGALSRLRRQVAPGHRFSQTAIEIHAEADRDDPPRLDFGLFHWGYAWDFPKRGLRSVGLGGRAERTGDQKALLAAYLERLGLPAATRVSGWPLPDRPLWKRVRGRLLFTGDAAGLCEPISGEGIYYALRSGERAALAIARGLAGELRDADPVRAVGEAYEAGIAFVLRQIHASLLFRPLFYRPGAQRRLLTALAELPELKDVEWGDVWKVALGALAGKDGRGRGQGR